MTIVKKYLAKVISVVHHFDNLYTLEFRNEAGIFKYKPGQFLHLALDPDYDGSGQWPESRCFSMQCKPGEATTKITYSVKGSFTRQMETRLKLGSIVWLKLPYGNLFSQQHNKINTVFIAGGTGITPFLSLFAHESFREYIKPKIYLGFKSKAFNIYNDELNKACNSSFSLKIYYEDVKGLHDIHQICSDNGTNRDYFISGPPMMIKSFKQALIVEGLSANQILTDDWE